MSSNYQTDIGQFFKWTVIVFVSLGIIYSIYQRSKLTDKQKITTTSPLKLSHQDSLTVVQNSLINFFKTAEYPKSYKSGPLQILPSNVVRLDSTLKIEGLSYVLLPKNSKINSLMRNMDYYKPLPYVEVVEFEIKGQRVRCAIIFRGTGQHLNSFLNKKLEVDSVSEGQI